MLEKQNKKECILSLVSALIVVLCTCSGVVMNLTTLQDVNFDHMGIQTFCMFTVLSNILVAVGMSLVIPYTCRSDSSHPDFSGVPVYSGSVQGVCAYLFRFPILSAWRLPDTLPYCLFLFYQ